MISILTWNVKMLPGPIGGGSQDLLRAKSLSEAIVDLDPDVVCLQEVFDEDIRDALVHYLSMTYGHIVQKGDMPWDVRQDSGLFLASKLPVNSQRFVAYEPGVGADALASKGILCVTIEYGDSALYFLNTHLQADYNSIGEHGDIRLSQLKKLLSVSHFHVYPTVVTGDFNIVAEEPGTDIETPEYMRMMRILGLRDVYRSECKDPGYTLSPDNKMCNEKESSRVDYILSSEGVSCDRTAVMRMNDLSDHFAVYAEVEA